MISIMNQLLNVNTSDDLLFVLFYDTTLKFGDFYVSPFVFRNIIFKDEPSMPVAHFIHGRENIHSKFVDFEASTFPKLKKESYTIYN